MNMKKINLVILALCIMLAVTANLAAAITYSPPAPKTGETVFFTLSPTTGSPTGSISWNFGDNSPAQSGTSLTVTHVYAAIGSYTAKASYATMSHFQVDQVTVTVIDPRQISYSPLQPKAGQAVAFTAQNFFSSCIRWDFGDATIQNGAAAESHTYANPGSYTVHAYEECGGTYGAGAMVTVAKADEKPPDEEPPPVTPGQPALAVSIVSLYFAGGKADISVAKDSAGLQALADIQVKGTGILQWQWLVDSVAVKADTLAVSFDNKYTLDSGKIPGLPTTVPGRHQVTLRFQNPKTDFAIPVITYFVALKGPAPVVIKVTPATLAPGAEYTLELEGAELTPDTEISFPAPIALLKKAAILSSTQAKAIVFVPITSGSGPKAVSVWNEYGKSSGPGQVTIAPPKPSATPGQGTPTVADSVKRPGQLQALGVTFTTPAGGESWLPGRPITITYSFWMDTNYHCLMLCRDKVPVGLILSTTIPLSAGQTGTRPWQVGLVCTGMVEPGCEHWAPPGEYTIGVYTVPGAEPRYFSKPFTILDISPLFTRYNKIYYGVLPSPGDCPECLILDLPGLHEEMVNSEYALTAGLYWNGRPIADLGKFGKGQGFPAKLQIKLEPAALAAMKRGEKFELRLFDDAGKQFHSQRTQLLPLPPTKPATIPGQGTLTLDDSVKRPGQLQAWIVTFTCPAGGESWFPGTPIHITYSFSWTVNRHYVQLYKDNTYLGPMHTNSNSYQPGQSITLDWRAGEIADLNTHPITNTFVPAGSGYRIAISLTNYEGDPMAFSEPFTIINPIIPPQPAPPPLPDTLASLEGFKEMLKKTPAITGGIDLRRYQYGSDAAYGQVNIFVKKSGAPVSGVVVKVDGNIIPENSQTPGHYFAEPQLALQPGHVFLVTAQIDGATYTGSGGKIDTIVHLTQPAHGSTIYFKAHPQFDCKWTFSNGPAQVHLYALYIGLPGNKGIFEQDLTADHVSIPTAAIPGAQGSLNFFLGRKYADIKFDGLLALTSGLQVYQNFGQPQGVAGLSESTLEKAPMLKMTGATPAQAAAAQPGDAAIVTELKTTPTLNGHITYEINTDPDSAMAARSTFYFYRADGPIPDAVINVDGVVIPPNTNTGSPDYGCSGCYKWEGAWPIPIAVGHVTTISITANGTTYTGSGGPIDSFPQLVKPAEGATVSLQQTPYLDLQWTGAGGIVPVFLNVAFRGGGKYVELFNAPVNTDHAQVHLVKPYDGIPEGASGVITVSLTKEYNRMVMDGLMRFTSSPHVFVQKRFYLKLIP
jgi:hypothetical protein